MPCHRADNDRGNIVGKDIIGVKFSVKNEVKLMLWMAVCNPAKGLKSKPTDSV